MAGTHPFDQVALAVGYRWGYAEERIRQLVTGTALDSVPAGWLPAVVIILISLPLSNLLLSQVTGKTSKSYTPRGCRRIGINNGSNLKDEFDAKYAAPAADGVTRVKSLWVYPIKSCGGIEVDGEDIASYGFKYDRQLTFAQLKDTPTLPTDEPAKPRPEREWKFLTQREYPLMATVKLQMWVPDPDSKDYDATSEEAQSGGVLVVSYPSPSKSGKRRSFAVPFAPTEAQIKGRGYKYERITIWKDTVSALNMPFEAPEDLQKYLGVKNEITLFKIDNIGMREVYRCAPRKEDIGYQPVTGFQDAYPIHLINLASVRHLETLLDSTKAPPPKLSVERFRANIIVTGPPEYDEDTWKTITIGSARFDVSCRTARCKLPNTDQETGAVHSVEPDRALRKYRNIDPGAGKFLGCLGMQMVPLATQSYVEVGDVVTVDGTGKHSYIKQ